MKSRPTIKDLATAVGVSPSTVSYVLNQNTDHKISESTRKAILEAAERLQYVPNGAARSLRYNSSHCISVAMEKSVTLTRHGAFLQGIREGLQAEGYWLMLFDQNSSGAMYPDYLDSVLQRRADGIIYISSDGGWPDEKWRKMILANNLPFVACDCCLPEPELASVSFDYERAAFELGCFLLGEGAERIVYWRPSIDTDQESYREAGLRRALQRYPYAELLVVQLPYEEAENSAQEERYAAFSRICKQHMMQDIVPHLATCRPNDAVICSWAIMVKHLCSLLNGSHRGIKVASFSDAELPVLPEPRVLASRPNFRAGGKACAKLILEQVRGEHSETNRVLIAPDVPKYVDF